MTKRLLGTILVLSFLLAACGSPGLDSGRILSLEEMPDGFEGPEVIDITDTSALVIFTSGLPTACSVTYGSDTTYGALATDAMMGGAVREHDVLLTSLAPDTIYHYRVNLVDEQGRVYQSSDFTFKTYKTPPEGEVSVTGENVALLSAGARVIGVSSNYSGSANDSAWGANNAIDGDLGTEWSSNGDGDDAWIEIELVQDYDVSAIGFWTRTMSNDTAQIFRFTVTTDQGETFGPFDLPDADQLYVFPVQFTARTLRFDAVETNTGNTGAVEIEVYDVPHGP